MGSFLPLMLYQSILIVFSGLVSTLCHHQTMTDVVANKEGFAMSQNSIQDYEKRIDDRGEAYFCPIESASEDLPSDWIDENCVEAAVVGRYSGHIRSVDG